MEMDDLLIKYLLGEATPDEKARFGEWLSADDRNRRRYEEFRTVWTMSRRTIAPDMPDRQVALERFRQRRSMAAAPAVEPALAVEPAPEVEPAPSVNSVRRSFRPWRAAAILVGLLVMGAVIRMVFKQPRETPAIAAAGDGLRRTAPRAKPATAPDSPAQAAATKDIATKGLSTKGISTKDIAPARTKVAPGWNTIWAGEGVRMDTLPDGTVVTLNRQAHIAYITGLKDAKGNGRAVRLEGEAFFVVAPDASHPFIVRANDITVKVLGTSFNISSRPGSTEVMVETGAVRVSRAGDSLLLQAGYKTMALQDQTGLVATVNRDKHYAGYRHAFVLPKKIPPSTANAKGQAIIVRNILTDLVRYKVIPDEYSITSFALDYKQFIVDDRPMPDSLHVLFNAKYIQPDSLGYYYGPVKAHGKGYFYEKKDLKQIP
jgi:hypothetical protein